MKTALRVVAIIFTPVIITLLLRLAIGIINLIFDELLDWFGIYMRHGMFDFEENWWFWLIVAILSVIAIFYELLFIEGIDE